MNVIKPPKLKSGDEVRIVAPVMSLAIHESDRIAKAQKRLEDFGLKISISKHAYARDVMDSSSIEERISDIHDAFADPNVKMIIAAEGGFNSNQLLQYLDWGLIQNNPKIFCGYSDVTTLAHAILVKTGIMTYYGPLFASLGNDFDVNFTLNYFYQCLFTDQPITLSPAVRFNNDNWETEQERDTGFSNPGYRVIHEGNIEGTIIGGNLSTLALLQGTDYFPNLTDDYILCLEDDYEYQIHHFDRNLQSILHLPFFNRVKGLVLGRFETGSHASTKLIDYMIETKRELEHTPVIVNVDFGHTNPKITLPIGGRMHLESNRDSVKLTITNH